MEDLRSWNLESLESEIPGTASPPELVDGHILVHDQLFQHERLGAGIDGREIDEIAGLHVSDGAWRDLAEADAGRAADDGHRVVAFPPDHHRGLAGEWADDVHSRRGG